MSIADWTRSETIAPPRTITIKYSNQQGQQRSVALTSVDRSNTVTEYRTVQYEDEQGNVQEADVVARTVETKRTTQASVNGAMVASRLSFGLGLPAGDAITTVTTTSEYTVSRSGPVLVGRTTVTEIPMVELAAGLAVPNYELYTPGTAAITSTVRSEEFSTAFTPDGREMTRQATSTWIAYGLTLEGQQSFNEQMKRTQAVALDPTVGGAWTANMVASMTELVFQGTEVQVSIGRMPPPVKPSDQALVSDEINQGGDGRSVAKGQVAYTTNQFGTYVIKIQSLDMPYAPDDYFAYQ